MSGRRELPYARALRLAAYLERRTDGCLGAEIATDVPGYRGHGDVALAELVDQDRRVLRNHLGLDVRFDPDAQRYSLDVPSFTAAERAALTAAASIVDVDGMDRGERPADLSSAVAEDAARDLVLVHEIVLAMRGAIANGTPVRFSYRGEIRTVAPYCVGMWDNHWYTVGRQLSPRVDGEECTKFRLDHIEPDTDDVCLVLAPDIGWFTVPEEFNADDALRTEPEPVGQDPPVSAMIAITRAQLPAVLAEFDGSVECADGDQVMVTVEVRDYESFVVRLLGFGQSARLLGPEVLLERQRAWLEPQIVG